MNWKMSSMTLKSQPKCEVMTSASIKDRIEKVITSSIHTKLVCDDVIEVWMKSKNSSGRRSSSHIQNKSEVMSKINMW